MTSRILLVALVLIPGTIIGICWTTYAIWQASVVRAELPLLCQAMEELKEREPAIRRKLDIVRPDDEAGRLQLKIDATERETRDVLSSIKPLQAEAGAMAPRLKKQEDTLRSLANEQFAADRKLKSAESELRKFEQKKELMKNKISAAELERRANVCFAVRSAHLKIREQKLDEAKTILAAVPKDLRFWEWDYLQSQLNANGDGGRIELPLDFDATDAAPDTEDRGLLIAGAGKISRLAVRPDAVPEPILTFDGEVKAMAVHAKTRRLAILVEDKTKLSVEAWDLRKNERLARVEVANWKGRAELAFTADGGRLALSGMDDAGRIFRLPTLESLGSLDDPRH